MDPLRAAILQRADELERPFVYWGFADWLAWGWLEKTRVKLLLGKEITDLFVTFTPPDVCSASLTWTSVIFVVACRAGKSRGFEENRWDTVNHFVHAAPLRPGLLDEALTGRDTDQQALVQRFEKDLHSCLSAPIRSGADAKLISWYLDRDWAVQLTPSDGNCACGTIAVNKHRANSAAVFKDIRKRTATEMRVLSDKAWYRDAFHCAGEFTPVPRPVPLVPPVVVLDDADAPDPSHNGGGIGEDGFHDGADPSDGEHSSDASGGDASDGDASDDSVCDGPQEPEPVGPSDAVVLAWGMQRTDAGKKLVEDFGNADDADVLNIIALEELITLRHEYLAEKAKGHRPVKRAACFTKRVSSLLQQRLGLGKHYLEWYEQQNEEVRKRALAEYAVQELGVSADHPVPKSIRQKIYNCYKTYLASQRKPQDFVESVSGLGSSSGGVLPQHRRRRKGEQGRPVKGKELRYVLFQWFIDYRQSVKGRLWPRTVLREAIAIKKRITEWYRGKGRTVPVMPHLDLGKKGKKWLARWKRFYRISFKKCAKKFKVSRPKLLRRTKTTWLNAWTAMLVYKLLFGKDRARAGKPVWPYQHCRDQKGCMINETESKNSGTLAFEGQDADTGGLKTNHGQSRERVSLFTDMSNDPSWDPPLELCFKLKTGRRLRGLVLPPEVQMTLANSKSGSYNYEACMVYLDRHVPKWTEERAKSHDYRLMFLDDYAVHNMKDVFDLLWGRGFLKIKLGGGTTFILCTCDLDLHADLDRDYIEMDVDWAAAELRDRPWRVPQKTRQEVVDDWASIWHRFPHGRRGLSSFKFAGLAARPPERIYNEDGSYTIPLTGPDDWMINRDARVFFLANEMQRLRQERLRLIYDDFDAGKINTWDDVLNYQRDHSDSEQGGEHEEGEELLSERPLSSCAETDLDDDGPVELLADGDADALVPVASLEGSEPLVALAGPENTQMKELRVFEELIDRAKSQIADPRVAGLLMRHRKEMERSLRGTNREALRELDAERAQSLEEMRQRRQALHDEDVARKAEQQKERADRKIAEEKAAKKKAERKAQAEAVLLVDKVDWQPEDFGCYKNGKFDKTLTNTVRDLLREALLRTAPGNTIATIHLKPLEFISFETLIHLTT